MAVLVTAAISSLRRTLRRPSRLAEQSTPGPSASSLRLTELHPAARVVPRSAARGMWHPSGSGSGVIPEHWPRRGSASPGACLIGSKPTSGPSRRRGARQREPGGERGRPSTTTSTAPPAPPAGDGRSVIADQRVLRAAGREPADGRHEPEEQVLDDEAPGEQADHRADLVADDRAEPDADPAPERGRRRSCRARAARCRRRRARGRCRARRGSPSRSRTRAPRRRRRTRARRGGPRRASRRPRASAAA